MIFNSWLYIVFLSVVFIVYWSLLKDSIRLRNVFLLFVSYVFYGSWDWRFLSLIIFSTLVDYSVARSMENSAATKRKILLGVSMAANLGLLLFFKYYNFFIQSWVDWWSFFGISWNITFLKIVLPVGISFYTFQTMSYTIDVYLGKLKASRDWVPFFAYVAFFPQLVAGPIERARNLLPQFYEKKTFNWQNFDAGIRLIIWGLFKKVVVADYLATSVNLIFGNYAEGSSFELTAGMVFFAFQIYCDFSGYSDIAIGSARLLGFDLMKNFNTPYFSSTVPEFWRRWHISLSTWFRDYVYIPLGGSRVGTAKTIRNVFVVFLVSGLWHGANWTFIFWGFLHALFFLPYLFFNIGPGEGVLKAVNTVIVFSLVCISWVFFRSETLTDAFSYLQSIVHNDWYIPSDNYTLFSFLVIAVFLALDFSARDGEYPMILQFENRSATNTSYVFLVLVILLFSVVNEQSDFIYFQF